MIQGRSFICDSHRILLEYRYCTSSVVITFTDTSKVPIILHKHTGLNQRVCVFTAHDWWISQPSYWHDKVGTIIDLKSLNELELLNFRSGEIRAHFHVFEYRSLLRKALMMSDIGSGIVLCDPAGKVGYYSMVLVFLRLSVAGNEMSKMWMSTSAQIATWCLDSCLKNFFMPIQVSSLLLLGLIWLNLSHRSLFWIFSAMLYCQLLCCWCCCQLKLIKSVFQAFPVVFLTYTAYAISSLSKLPQLID